MGRSLNEITDESASHVIEDCSAAIAAWGRRGPRERTDREQYSDAGTALWTYRSLAAAKYQLEWPTSEIVEDLRKAAEWLLARHAIGSRIASEPEIIWTLYCRDLGLIAGFGTAAERAAFAGVEMSIVGEEPGEAGIEVARAWKAYLHRGQLDPRSLESIIAHCGRPEADDWDRHWAKGMALALQGITTTDPALLGAGLEEIAAFTRAQAMRGDWRLLTEGQLSLPGLGLCRLALECGMRPDVASEYIPIALIDGARGD